MPDKPNGVFISCASDEFEKAGATFPGLRSDLRAYLARTRSNVRVQEDFPQTAVDTVKKLAEEIRLCSVVIHLVGEQPGAIAHPAAVKEYLNAEPAFLASHPELRAALGDFSGISYTQWEAFIALHQGISPLVYATDKSSAQQTHLDRLKLGRRYATPIKSHTDLFGELIGDLHVNLPGDPEPTPKIAESPALTMWKKKLAFLLFEEAKKSNSAAKFEIQQDIEEARQNISELSKEIK